MKDLVLKRLNEVETEKDCRVLFACESGSRAWGFPSPDSDYDARFIYTHGINWHLQITPQKDTIERMLPNDLDVAGWELRKTLQLFAGCNLALNEWLGSPIVYCGKNSEFLKDLRSQIPNFFNGKKALHHYLSLAKNVEDKEWIGTEIKIKKLFYMLRSIYACLWIAERQSMPPTYFPAMLQQGLAPADIHEWIAALTVQKETAKEGEIVSVPDYASTWIQESLQFIQTSAESYPKPEKLGDIDVLNQVLRTAAFNL